MEKERVDAGPKNSREKYDEAEWQQLRRSVDAQRASAAEQQHAPHLYAASTERNLRMSADNSANKRIWIHVIEGSCIVDDDGLGWVGFSLLWPVFVWPFLGLSVSFSIFILNSIVLNFLQESACLII